MKTHLKLAAAPLVIAAATVPGTAFAQGPYIGVSGGLALPEDSQNEGVFTGDVPATDDFGAIAAGTEVGWNTEFDNGYVIGGQLGYAFDSGFRLEAEASYSEYDVDLHRDLVVGGANIDGVDAAILTRGPVDAINPTVGQVLADGQGSVSNLGLFGNVYYDIPTGTAFKPYIGAGAGVQIVNVDFIPSGVDVAEDDQAVFSYQLMGGASFEVTDTVELFGQYTYRDTTEEAEIPLNLLPADLGVDSAQSLVTAGVRIKFGG